MTPVSELLALKIENAQLKLQQLHAAAQQIVAEQQKLLEEARVEVGAPVGHNYDPATRLFVSPNGHQPLSAPAARQQKRARRA